MNLIAKITDENIGEISIEMNNPNTRIAVRTILLDENGNIGILHKTIKNEYKLVGGGVDEGENLEEALRRETLEESGCKIDIISYLGYIEELRSKKNFYQKSYIYVCKVIENTHHLDLTQKEKEEGAEICWLQPNEALEIMKTSFHKLKPSKYADLYATNFVVTRDISILKYYIENCNK